MIQGGAVLGVNPSAVVKSFCVVGDPEIGTVIIGEDSGCKTW